MKADNFDMSYYMQIIGLGKVPTDVKIKNVHVSAEENNGNLTFFFNFCDGTIDKSYGINVASLANLPKEVIDRANEILEVYEKKNVKTNPNILQTSFDFDSELKKGNDALFEEIEKIDPLNLTPIEAMNKLYEIIKKIKER